MDSKSHFLQSAAVGLAIETLSLVAQMSTVLRSSYKKAEAGRLYWLDSLRFTAAFMVVAIHARGQNWVEWARLSEESQSKLAALFFATTRAGTEWVLVFFVLSGFLVGGKLIERIQLKTFSAYDYTIDRLTRIWIPLVPALAWSAIVAIWVGKPIVWWDLVGNLVGLQGVVAKNFATNQPLWSLSYEIWFYLLAGFVAIGLTYAKTVGIWTTFGIALAFIVFSVLDTEFLFAWILGASSYWMCQRRLSAATILMAGCLIGTGILITQASSSSVSFDASGLRRWLPSGAVGIIILGFGLSLLIPMLARMEPRTSRAKTFDFLGTRLATCSYTLYLTHYPLLYLWEYYFPYRYEAITVDSLLVYLLRIVSCIIFGWLFYLPFEKRTGKIRIFLKSHAGLLSGSFVKVR